MKLVERYIAKTVLAAIALVTLMLAGLQIFILFVAQLNDLGKADYNIIAAALYVLLQMPYQVYLFFPMASMLGCLIGLGILANNSELVVMRAAGMSVSQIALVVLKAAMIIIVVITLVGEMIVPRLAHFANDQKLQALSRGQTLRTANGVWFRHKNDFIFIGAVISRSTLFLVYQYRFDEQHRLRLARMISRVDFINNQWIAHDVAETSVNQESTTSRRIPAMIWDVDIKPKIINVSANEPDEMTLPELRQVLRDRKLSHQNTINYQVTYWQRVVQPLTTAVMMILAIPFIFGPLRSSTMGSKLLAGAAVGFGFHIVNRFFGPISQVLQWPPEIAAIGPTCLFALLGLYLMRRVR